MRTRRIVPSMTMSYDREKITALRRQMGLSMAELARRAGIKQPTVWAIETGKTKQPEARTMQAIAEVLGVPYNVLVAGRRTTKQAASEELLAVFHGLPPDQQASLLAAARAFLAVNLTKKRP